MKKIVIAIGGNAILNPEKGSPIEQQQKIDQTCSEIADIISKGFEVILTHGNGPQIGNILEMQEECGTVHPQHLDVCGAQTQGMLGYLLQQSLYNNLKKRGLKKQVVTLLTQVLIDESDPAFLNPTKPIGVYYSEYRGKKMVSLGMEMIKSKKGYRRVVPSPEPKKIIEEDIMKNLINKSTVIIAGGGGGIPVIEKNGFLTGIEAVIDKDLTASLMASAFGAEILLILTDVEKAYLNYETKNQTELGEISVSEAEIHVKDGHFGKGSMEPKIIAAIKFIKNGGKIAIISSLGKALLALEGKEGTRIIKKVS